ncbi:MAG: tetratricopeptide repeat protein, partial [Deltaproteobacteria bacterium]|nr:tetratricopeptide repeat protein [Deltaproteobacteria bacterium]
MNIAKLTKQFVYLIFLLGLLLVLGCAQTGPKPVEPQSGPDQTAAAPQSKTTAADKATTGASSGAVPDLPEFVKAPVWAIFPLENATGKPELDWLSIGLQDSLTVDLWYVSALNTKALTAFVDEIGKVCPKMGIDCVGKLKLTDWQTMAGNAKLDKFIWGSYRQEGGQVAVTLRLYQGPAWTVQGEVSFTAPLDGLMKEATNQLQGFLAAQGVTVKSEEKDRILTTKTGHIGAWEQNAQGFWWQQKYSADEKNRPTLAPVWEKYLMEAVRLDPNYAEAWDNLGCQRITAEKWDTAAQAFTQALKLKPYLVDANAGMGYALIQKKEPLTNIPYLKQAINFNPALLETWTILMAGYDQTATEYKQKGDYPKALEHCNQALAISLKVRGSEHPDTASSYNKIGLVYWFMGNYPKALENHSKALSIRLKVLGPEHPDTATSYNNIASVYWSMGDYPKALENHSKALAIDLKVLGPEHPDIATSYSNIGSVHDSMGDYPKALENHQKALAIYLKVLGPEHPSTATSYNNIGEVYRNMGDYPKALENRQKALA